MGEIIDFPGSKVYDIGSDTMRRLTSAEIVRLRRLQRIARYFEIIEKAAKRTYVHDEPTKPAA